MDTSDAPCLNKEVQSEDELEWTGVSSLIQFVCRKEGPGKTDAPKKTGGMIRLSWFVGLCLPLMVNKGKRIPD